MNMVGSELYHDSEIQSNESNPVGTVLLVAQILDKTRSILVAVIANLPGAIVAAARCLVTI